MFNPLTNPVAQTILKTSAGIVIVETLLKVFRREEPLVTFEEHVAGVEDVLQDQYIDGQTSEEN